jgi:hypothetical protein
MCVCVWSVCVCVCDRSETYSVLESAVTVMIAVNTCVTDLFRFISGNCSDNFWSPDRYCRHEFSVTAHWFLLHPSARRPSLRAGLVKVFNQLVYYGLLVSQRCSQNRWWPPLILLLLNKAQTDKWRLRAGARGIISVEVNLHLTVTINSGIQAHSGSFVFLGNTPLFACTSYFHVFNK